MKKLFNIFFKGTMVIFLLFSYVQGNVANGQSDNAAVVVKNQHKEINITNWPETAQKAAKAMIEKYGQPAESTPSMLIWHNSGPFKRTIVYKEEIQHDFPMPHKDVLEQFIDYEVPADKFDDLAMFDGSVICERTKGEMSARCDKEGANILALNLSHDIIQDKRSVDESRAFYADAMMKMMTGEMPPYIQSMQFDASRVDTQDAGETTMDMSKVKEVMGKQ